MKKINYAQYPSVFDFMQEYSDRATPQFTEDLLNFCRSYPDLMDDLNKSFNLIKDHPIPQEGRAVWEILKYYSLDLQDFVTKYFRGLKNGINIVCSFAIYKDSTSNAFNKIDRDRDVGLRLVYEIVNSDHIIFTNLNFHIYRNSSYCDSSDIKTKVL